MDKGAGAAKGRGCTFKKGHYDFKNGHIFSKKPSDFSVKKEKNNNCFVFFLRAYCDCSLRLISQVWS